MMVEPSGVDGSSLSSICSHSVVGASKNVELRAVRINTAHNQLAVPVVDKTLRRTAITTGIALSSDDESSRTAETHCAALNNRETSVTSKERRKFNRVRCSFRPS